MLHVKVALFTNVCKFTVFQNEVFGSIIDVFTSYLQRYNCYQFIVYSCFEKVVGKKHKSARDNPERYLLKHGALVSCKFAFLLLAVLPFGIVTYPFTLPMDR